MLDYQRRPSKDGHNRRPKTLSNAYSKLHIIKGDGMSYRLIGMVLLSPKFHVFDVFDTGRQVYAES